MELRVNDVRDFPLDWPRLGARAEVTASHAERHGQVTVIGDVPVKLLLLHNVGQPRLVGEEHGQVGGEDCLLHHVEHFLVLLGVEAVEDAVGLLLQDAHTHAAVQVYSVYSGHKTGLIT